MTKLRRRSRDRGHTPRCFVCSTMNAFGNIAGIVTPIVLGYLVASAGSFDTALWFVSAHGLLAVVALAGMGILRRVEFDVATETRSAPRLSDASARIIVGGHPSGRRRRITGDRRC
ncbi:hypothetical protein ACQP0C_12660 [Nocardia sp. CA-129566]|uniref:hypothetical protein n=1 Tax=Nocardia sp. CA-129566 TaxID=3239976 RepID=UPI003D997BE6